MPPYRGGRLTLGLYNSYDPNHFHEAMRRAIARAAPLAAAFEYNLALFGFPFHAYRTKEGVTPRPETPQDLAALVADSTTIGEGGEYLLDLAKSGRFQSYAYPDPGFPPQLGAPVLATEDPEASKQVTLDDLARRVNKGSNAVVVVGLGPRGVPAKVRGAMPEHLELTGKNYSLETATALGVLAGRLASSLESTRLPKSPWMTADAIVEKDGQVLLIRRGRPPWEGMWALPGGFVDRGETVEAAAKRELEEETGIRAETAELLGVYSEPERDPRGHIVTLAFVMSGARGEPRGGDDAADARYHPLNRLPPLASDHERILAEYVASQARPSRSDRVRTKPE